MLKWELGNPGVSCASNKVAGLGQVAISASLSFLALKWRIRLDVLQRLLELSDSLGGATSTFRRLEGMGVTHPRLHPLFLEV